jgi:quercetin dioxygenase-like cupin family protein
MAQEQSMRDLSGLARRGILSGQGPDYSLAGNLVSILAGEETTGGAYGMIEAIVPPGVGAPMHIHHREDEGFHILDGELDFQLDGVRIAGVTGSCLHLPRGVSHGYINRAARPARVICIYAPGGCEGFFVEGGEVVDDVGLAIAAPRPPDAARVAAVASRYGLEILDPSPA